mmetsp:Transcript_96969/g.278617  ORF Transcript_96969/g.278617 Transcript_96969/m.278617 type:complete len:154 (-) Transcript_96969:1300-1761(-)
MRSGVVLLTLAAPLARAAAAPPMATAPPHSGMGAATTRRLGAQSVARGAGPGAVCAAKRTGKVTRSGTGTCAEEPFMTPSPPNLISRLVSDPDGAMKGGALNRQGVDAATDRGASAGVDTADRGGPIVGVSGSGATRLRAVSNAAQVRDVCNA